MISGKLAAPGTYLRRKIHSGWPEWIALALYAALVSFAIFYHEPWADEAQAWQLARSLSLHELFQTYVRYEGSPGLWHFLLWTMIRAHISYSGMHWICGVIAFIGVSVLVLNSPFPRYLKLILPFTYFLFFQYAVIARNYVLVPLVLFIIAACWKRSPILMGFMLGILANISLHTAVISGGLAIIYFMTEISAEDTRKNHSSRELIISLLVLFALYAFAIWTAWPPHDLLLSRVRGHSRPFLPYAVGSLVWGICQPWILGIPFWIAIAFCLRGRQRLPFLLPVLLFAIFCGTIYVSFWHAGLLAPLAICLLWITWTAPGWHATHSEIVGLAAILFMAVVQILWSAKAITYDHLQAYSPNLAAAQFLTPLVHRGATIAVTYLDEPEGNQAFDAIGILPYFDRNIYLNQPAPFWSWSDKNPTEDRFATALRVRPRIVLVETRPPHPGPLPKLSGPKIELITKAGYRLTNVFCGTMPDRLQLGLRSCHLIFQQPDAVQNECSSPAEVSLAPRHRQPAEIAGIHRKNISSLTGRMQSGGSLP